MVRHAVYVEYWDGSLPLRMVATDASGWGSLSRDDVVWAYVVYEGRPGKAYTLRLLGADYYYVYGEEDTVVFGQWTDPIREWAAEGHAGIEYRLRHDGLCVSRPLALPPMRTTDGRVKLGVMLPDDEATEIGLIGDGPSQLMKHSGRLLG